MLAEAPVDGPDMVSRVEVYDADVARLRALGCRCPLRYVVWGDRACAAPQNALVAATCTVDHEGSYTT